MSLRHFFALGLCLAPGLALAQVSSGSLNGNITDSVGGGVPKANVKVRNEATGITFEAASNDTGFYSVPNLQPAIDRKSTRLNSSHIQKSRMPSSA